MTMDKILGFIGGYENKKTFEINIPHIAEVTELTEEEIENEIDILKDNGDIELTDNTINLINIEPKINKRFNNLYAPIETLDWKKGTKLKLDK